MNSPECWGCGKYPDELPIYKAYRIGEESMDDVVRREEGTCRNGYFYCDGCYIAAGQPLLADLPY